MTHEQAKSELMQIYMSLSEEKKMALDVLMAQADGEYISKEKAIIQLSWDLSEVELPRIKESLDKLPSVAIPSAEPKWIPVSEPPKEIGTYLIQTDGEPYMCQCRWTDVNPFWTDYKTKPHWNIFDLPQYSKVVAWMPLPAPFDPQESEDKE